MSHMYGAKKISKTLVTPVKFAIARVMYMLSNAHSIMSKDIMVAELGRLKVVWFSGSNTAKISKS